MTESVKEMLYCLICNIKLSTSKKNCIKIFDENSLCDSQKTLLSALNHVLETECNENNVHSDVICKKCFNLFNEHDKLTNKLAEIENDIFENYKKTIKNLTDIVEEESDHEYFDPDEILKQLLGECSQHTMEEDSDILLKSPSPEKEVHINVEYLIEDELESVINEDEPKSVINEDEAESVINENESESVVKEYESESIINKDESKSVINEYESESVINKEYVDATDSEDNMLFFNKITNTFTCLLCPEDDPATGNFREIIAHLKVLHNEKIYLCDMCGAEFKTWRELDDHVAKEEGDFQCEDCNRIFSNLRLFKIHKHVHNPYGKSWTCEQCGKKYLSKNLLKEHMNIHTGKRPHVCKVCDKGYASKYSLKDHLKTHK